jgi:NADH-quinone oxidoreductase subunit C
MSDEFERGLGGLDSGPGRTADGEPVRGTSTDAAHPSVSALRAEFGDAILHHELQAGDEHVVFIEAARNVEILRWLHDPSGHDHDLLIDLTAVDYGGGRPIQVVYQLWSIGHRRALRIKAELPLHDLQIESVVPIWSGANWLEREVYDLFGVEFRGHPDLRRIMMPDNYAEGHPLRKDFPLRGRFSRAEQTRRALSFDLADYYTREELAVLSEWEERHAREHATGSVGFPGDVQGSRDPRDAETPAEGSP